MLDCNLQALVRVMNTSAILVVVLMMISLVPSINPVGTGTTVGSAPGPLLGSSLGAWQELE